MDKRSTRYLMIVAGNFLLLLIVSIVRNSAIGDVFVIRQIMSILPNFLVAIIVPFGLIALIRLLTKTWRETRIFYCILFGVLFVSILYEYIQGNYWGDTFDIYDIIASGIGVFADMILYDRFETEALKRYQVITNKKKVKTK